MHNQFRLIQPKSLKELSAAMAETMGIRRYFLAGGTDLWVDLTKGKKTADAVIDLKGIEAFHGWTLEGDMIRMGALTTIHEIEQDETLKALCPALPEACKNLGSLQVRNRATIGGNVGNAAPTADTAPTLVALNAEAVIWSAAGETVIPITQFWKGAGKNVLQEDQVLAAIRIPVRNGNSWFLKVGPRQAMDIAILSAAVRIKLEDGKIADCGIGLGGAASVPLRCEAAQAHLMGKVPSRALFAEAGTIAAENSNPRDSSRASRAYRLELIPVLVERALMHASGLKED